MSMQTCHGNNNTGNVKPHIFHHAVNEWHFDGCVTRECNNFVYDHVSYVLAESTPPAFSVLAQREKLKADPKQNVSTVTVTSESTSPTSVR